MTTTTTLNFSDILLKTRMVNIRLIALMKGMRQAGIPMTTEFVYGLEYDPVDAEEAQWILEAVEFALDLVGETPNAYINQEALAAFNRIVEHIDHALEDDWIQPILDKHLYGGSFR